MDATIASALISAGVTLAVCLITNHAQAQKTEALLCYKLEELQKRVEKHNTLIERTYKLEESSAVHDAELRRVNHRLENLESIGKGDDGR